MALQAGGNTSRPNIAPNGVATPEGMPSTESRIAYKETLNKCASEGVRPIRTHSILDDKRLCRKLNGDE
ncbi:hypothetical protein AB833_10095 [Chromatiales bacterium (ex Bugula neritina AB1)]|nr:hypothetical protein AB833_10095 [Chromatiales bacterium (ex Bugula neritina AB1)]